MATQHAHAPEHQDEHPAHAEHSHHPNYVRIYVVLLVLLGISIIGPEAGIRWVTLATAFGVAVWKAYLVAKNFMHLNFAPRYVGYLVATTLLFMLLFFAAVAPDVMKQDGTRWVKPDGWQQTAGGHAAEGHGAEDPGGGGH
ncbi:MAG TPA: cytochrome C oxidase subunit IV family protein [Myxococcota bacterium]|nr:cytochrome C oxidase subunit IV family protein [Myxococcota bacterium]